MKFLLGGIRFYRAAISPLTRPSCRFVPSCSAYALEALERHGALRGFRLTLRRLSRCHPLGGQGFDPVPPRSPGAHGGVARGRAAEAEVLEVAAVADAMDPKTRGIAR